MICEQKSDFPMQDEKERVRVRQLFYNKRKLSNWKFLDFDDFYQWHQGQHIKQNGKCYYCGVEEYKLKELIEGNVLKSKRFGNSGIASNVCNRGKKLEIERIISHMEYSRDNCVLACYFCNNDKSDIVSDSDYFKYFINDKNMRRQFIDDKYSDFIIKSKPK